MTTATHPLTGQPTATSMSGPQGAYVPGFPPPIGAEQIFGLVPPLTPLALPSAAVPNATQQYGTQYGTVPWQQAITPFAFSPVVQQATTPFAFSPVVQQVAAQIAPIAQQTLLPYVIGAAWQQVQHQLPQIVAQIVAQPMLPWQQHLTPMGSGIFGQFSRPYSAYLS